MTLETAPPDGGLTHAEIRETFAATEPNIHYVGSCDGSVRFEGEGQPGSTPFCGIILDEAQGEVIVSIIDDGGFESQLRFERIDGVWTWELN